LNPSPPTEAALPRPDGVHQWAVIHSRPRCEKRIAEFCQQRGLPCYLPILAKRRTYGRRVRVFEHPVFPGYLFALADAPGRQLLRQNQRVANLLEVPDQATLIRQLDQVKTALDQHDTFELLPQIVEGTRVTVQAGPLKGVEGVVSRFKNRTRVVLNIDFIQQALAVEVEAEWLIPV